MNNIHEELIERIRGEVPDLDRLVHRALRAWSRAQISSDEEEIYVDSLALNLHGFYSGVERLFELIARHVDRHTPDGEMWHRHLVKQMAQERPKVRPAVISHDTVSALDQMRRFRHLVRNVYTFNLAPDKIKPLITNLESLWNQLKAELLAFADFLEQATRIEDKN